MQGSAVQCSAVQSMMTLLPESSWEEQVAFRLRRQNEKPDIARHEISAPTKRR